MERVPAPQGEMPAPWGELADLWVEIFDLWGEMPAPWVHGSAPKGEPFALWQLARSQGRMTASAGPTNSPTGRAARPLYRAGPPDTGSQIGPMLSIAGSPLPIHSTWPVAREMSDTSKK